MIRRVIGIVLLVVGGGATIDPFSKANNDGVPIDWTSLVGPLIVAAIGAVMVISSASEESPTTPPEQPLVAGWHPDPSGRNEYRYWDGAAWSAHVSNGGLATTDPAT